MFLNSLFILGKCSRTSFLRQFTYNICLLMDICLFSFLKKKHFFQAKNKTLPFHLAGKQYFTVDFQNSDGIGKSLGDDCTSLTSKKRSCGAVQIHSPISTQSSHCTKWEINYLALTCTFPSSALSAVPLRQHSIDVTIFITL